jgi:hypothetical protein
MQPGLGSFLVHYGEGSLFPDSVVLSNFLAAAIPGDYNQNGTVDAADYVVWRKTDGTQTGYNIWRTNFGEPGGSGSAASATASAPEPSTLVMLMFAAAVSCIRPRGAA